MGEYYSGGVYIEEKSSGARSVAGVGTSAVAIVGKTEKGPIDEAVLVTSYQDFVDNFGGMKNFKISGTQHKYFDVPMTLRQFLANDGSRGYVVRVQKDAISASGTFAASGGGTAWNVEATSKGIWGNRIDVKLSSNLDYVGRWDVTISYAELPTDTKVVVELHEAVELTDDTSKDYICSVVNANSDYVDFTKVSGGAPSVDPTTLTLSGGHDGSAITVSELGDSTSGALKLFNNVGEMIALTAPDEPYVGVDAANKALIDYAGTQNHVFAIILTASGLTATEARDYMRDDLNKNSSYYAIYYPWAYIADPLNDGRKTLFPPLGVIAGVYARTDKDVNVGKSPGGLNDGQMAGILSLEKKLERGEMDTLYPARVNPLLSDSRVGMAVWGVRTGSLDSEWKYINCRRLFQYVELTTEANTQWVVFENNNVTTRSLVKYQLDAWLGILTSKGYFASQIPSKAYAVICDETNNTQATIGAGYLYVDVYIAPNKPAEFVVIRIRQKLQAA